MNDRPSIRPMHLSDAAAVAALVRAAFADLPERPDPPMSALRVTDADIAAHLAAGGGVVAVVAESVVGSLLWAERDQGLYLSRIAVAPGWRGHGIARAMVAATEPVARGMGLPRLHLSTRLVLAGNRRLFAACGFREVACHAHPGYATPTTVEMEKLLQPMPRQCPA